MMNYISNDILEQKGVRHVHGREGFVHVLLITIRSGEMPCALY